MVLSYDDGAEYSELMHAQQQTWDSINEPFTKVVYYTGGCPNHHDSLFKQKQIWPWSMQYAYKCSDHYYDMHWKFKLCLDHWLMFPLPFYVFRTNSSSYINKKLLREFVDSLPDEKVYAGWAGHDFISGAGFVISPDVQKILSDEDRKSVV